MGKAERLIESEIRMLHRRIEGMLEAAAEKDRHVRGLIANGQIALMASDLPVGEWQAINGYMRAIGHMSYVLADARRRAPKRRATQKGGE